jgi:hypothetical protein
MALGLGLGRRGRGVPAPFSVAFTGLSDDSLGAYGQIGNHESIGFTVAPPEAVVTWKWSASSNPANAATFGAEASPTDFSAFGRVYLHVTDGTFTRTRSFPVRFAPGAFGPLAGQTVTQGTGTQSYTFPAATGAGLTWTYSLVNPPAGVTLSGRTVTFDRAVVAVQQGAFTVRAADQYGRAIDVLLGLLVNPAPDPTVGTVFTLVGTDVEHTQAGAVPPASFTIVGTEVVMETA